MRHTKGNIGDDVELGMTTFWETCKEEEVEVKEHKRKLESPSAPPLNKSAICIMILVCSFLIIFYFLFHFLLLVYWWFLSEAYVGGTKWMNLLIHMVFETICATDFSASSIYLFNLETRNTRIQTQPVENNVWLNINRI